MPSNRAREQNISFAIFSRKKNGQISENGGELKIGAILSTWPSDVFHDKVNNSDFATNREKKMGTFFQGHSAQNVIFESGFLDLADFRQVTLTEDAFLFAEIPHLFSDVADILDMQYV